MGILPILFIAAMVALYVFQNFFCKLFSFSYPGSSSHTTSVLTVVTGIIVAIVSFFFSGMTFKAQALTIILGILNAFVFYSYNFFFLKCSTNGPYSVLMVFAIFGGIVFPSAAKWIGFGEAMTGPAICFLALVMIAVYLMSNKPNDAAATASNKITAKFIGFCFCLGLSNGLYNIILILQQELTGEAEKEELVMITFLGASVISLVSLILGKANLKKAMVQTKKSALHLVLYALSSALAINSLVIILLLDINVGVLYTVQNAGIMLLSVLLSMICFKEKLSKVNAIGCIVMTIGLVGITICEKITFAQAFDIIKGLLK